MLLRTLLASLLGNMSPGKGFTQAGDGAMSRKERGTTRACKGAAVIS